MQEIYIKQFNQTVAFPDEFTDDQIKDAIQSNILPQLEQEDEERRRKEELENQGFFGRAADLLEMGGREFAGASAEGVAGLVDYFGGDSTDEIEHSLQGFSERQEQAV